MARLHPDLYRTLTRSWRMKTDRLADRFCESDGDTGRAIRSRVQPQAEGENR